MKRLFKWLHREGYCPDYTQGVEASQKAQISDISVFSIGEVQSIIETPNDLHFLFLLALSTGMRLGELLALTFSDFRDGAVHVTKQVNENYDITDGVRTFRQTVKEPK